MSRVTDRKIRYLQHRSVIPSIIFFVISLVLGVALVFATSATIFGYLVGTGVLDSQSQLLNIKSAITKQHVENIDYQDIMNDLEKETNHPAAVAVLDSENNILASYGNIDDIDDAYIVNENEDIDLDLQVRPDFGNAKNNHSIKKNYIDINLFDIGISFMHSLRNENPDQVSDVIVENLSKSIYEFNYWMRASLDKNPDDATLLVKFTKSINMGDCLIIIAVFCVSLTLFLILIIVHLINTISNIANQRYLVKLILKDSITDGNNYNAYENFAIKGISSGLNRKKEYAIVDLSLVKYQNYCTLYGTDEGERLLISMDKAIKKYLGKGEIHARVSNADFILLLRRDVKYSGITDVEDATSKVENELVKYINQMIENLPDDFAHTYSRGAKPLKGLKNIKFKAGVYFIQPVVANLSAVNTENENKSEIFNRKYSIARRKKNNLNVDQLYIKAGIAKQAILEDSGLVVYNHEMWEKELWEQKVQEKMQAALDNEEFQVYIQPKYHPATEELVGGEALVRWISPTEGFISPGQFIPIFEKTGFVTKLDDYMISHTAKLQSNWLGEGKKIVPISVNVSRAHFAQEDLAEHIRDLVDEYPLPHKYIEIELTESAFFDDKKALLTTVRRLQEYGFEVSMDDFGSGYSSLNSLKDLPLNVLKLDAEFFRGDDFDTRGEIVVAEAISLAKQLNMRIVAEGVEKKEQVDFLAKQECDMIQGYYFAKPMPANEYETRMK